MSKDDVLKNLREYGQILFKHQPIFISDLIMNLLKEDEQKTKLINPVLFLNLFENPDEMFLQREATHVFITLQFIEFCYKNFGSISESKKEVGHFILSMLCFFIKNIGKTRTSLRQIANPENNYDFFVANISEKQNSANVNKTKQQSSLNTPIEPTEFSLRIYDRLFVNCETLMSLYLENETFLRACDASYLTLLFDSAKIVDAKIRILELKGRKVDVIRELFESEEFAKCLKFCEKYKNDAEISIYFLKLLCNSSSNRAINSSNLHISQILRLIMEQDVFQPHFVLKILKQNKNLKLKDVKFYLTNLITKNQASQAEFELKLQTNVKQVDEKVKILENLTSKTFLVQPNLCTLCKSRLANPAIYFFCGHFYHKNCVYDNSCPECVC